MTPNAAPLDRAAIAREATLQLVNEFTDGTLSDAFRLTPAQRARMLGYIDGEYPAPSPTPPPTPPPIPLGAVVEAGPYHYEYQPDGNWWLNTLGYFHAHGAFADALTALYHARREAEELRERNAALDRELDEAVGRMEEAQTDEARTHREWADVTSERDEARSIVDRHYAHIKTLERERDQYERERDEARSALGEANARTARLRREIERKNRRIAHIAEQRNDAESLRDEWKSRYDDVQQERALERESLIEELESAKAVRDEIRSTLHRVAKRVGVRATLDHWHHDNVEYAIGLMLDTLECERDEAWSQARAVQQMLDAERANQSRTDAAPSPATAPLRNDRRSYWVRGQSEAAGASTGLPGPSKATGAFVSPDCRDMAPVPSADPRILTSTAWDWPVTSHTNTSPNADTPHADVVSETAPLSGAGNTGETGKPRRWWLVVDRDGDSCGTCLDEDGALDLAAYLERYAAGGPHAVVPVIEARVTREMVERATASVRDAFPRGYYAMARAALSVLGLTVEGDDHA